ncbi:MAG: VWA domain-containing protein [Acidobacteriota bacterium]
MTRVHRAGAGFLALALALSPATARELSAAQQPPVRPEGGPFRSGVDLVSLSVTVTDGSGRFVTDVDREQFQVFEDGVQQDVSFFNRSNLPLAVALLLDTSASMEDKMATAQEAASGFVRRLRPEDESQVIDFDSKAIVAIPFTNQHNKVEQAIRATVAGGSTSLYNALYIALKELRKTRARAAEELRRQAIVLLSDGEDTSSLVSFDEVLELAKRSETAIYAIGLRVQDPFGGKGYNEADYVLRQLTSQTGGRVFFPASASDLPAIYDHVFQELSSQYVLGYSSKNPKRDGRWRRVVVRVERPGTTARTKQGYYGPSPP